MEESTLEDIRLFVNQEITSQYDWMEESDRDPEAQYDNEMFNHGFDCGMLYAMKEIMEYLNTYNNAKKQN